MVGWLTKKKCLLYYFLKDIINFINDMLSKGLLVNEKGITLLRVITLHSTKPHIHGHAILGKGVMKSL